MPQKMDRYKVLAVRKPGQKGTKKLQAKYGSRLRCVRYLYDRVTGEHLKTVELVQLIAPYEPAELHPEEIVGVKIAFHEIELREKVKRKGGRWDNYDKLWILRYKDIESLGLENRQICIREEPAQYELEPSCQQ
jgi:hypothetical protein